MLLAPAAPVYQRRIQSHTGRVTTARGVSVTPGTNVKGSYAQIIAGAAVTMDVYAIEVWIASASASAAIRDYLVDIAIDPAGGTSYTIVIPDLFVSQHNNMTGGVPPGRYFFPLFIPGGASIGVRAAGTNTTAIRAFVTLYGEPKYPELAKAGSIVQAIGPQSANSRGTLVTVGTTAEGAWTSLGTTTRDAWWWQIGAHPSTSARTTLTYGVDLSFGPAGGERMIIEEAFVFGTSAETGHLVHPQLCACEVPAGSTIWGRAQSSGTNETFSMVAYAMS